MNMKIRKRHVSRKNPNGWYRTIDRIYPALAKQPKLLIPDIKGGAHIVYEDGMFYPHHNLYYITSEQWDLKVLQAVLQSGIAELFVNTYSTKMRGGYLRFQAQYLRRICVPFWRDVPEHLRRELVDGVKNGDISRRNEAIFKLYGMNSSERARLPRKRKLKTMALDLANYETQSRNSGKKILEESRGGAVGGRSTSGRTDQGERAGVTAVFMTHGRFSRSGVQSCSQKRHEGCQNS